MSFRPPVRDLQLALQAAGFDEVQALERFADADADTVTAVLDGAAAFAGDVLAPLNRQGDLVGARHADGKVTCAPGFADAYQAFAQGGWTSLSAQPDDGGQGLPKTLELAVFEMVHAANMAFGLCPMLSQAAIDALAAFGSPRQKALYLSRLVSGEWTGTMNLTESQAGSDLAAITTRAEPDGDGGYRLYGQKIFITWGDHDAAENIVHMVLARLPDAPAGVRGISLFLTPKRRVADDGAAGAPNALRAASIEHKLGIHGSPTCVMLFEGAHAELVGELNRGLAQMFVMMNAARLQVGVEGVAIGERAFQQALAYALERRQGKAAWSADQPARLFDHPDVRRTLTLMKAKVEAARGICLMTGVCTDKAHGDPDEARREAASRLRDLLTPIAKAWSTDLGVEVASMGVQVHGGMGFIEETGAAQHYRDARIAPIYEGTNGIQAADLVGRKVGGDGGRAAAQAFDEIAVQAEWARGAAGMATVGERLGDGLNALRTATAWIVAHQGPDALAGATAYLRLFGDVLGATHLVKLARLAVAGDPGDAALQGKIALAEIFAEQVLAQAPGLAAGVMAGGASLAAVTPQALGAG